MTSKLFFDADCLSAFLWVSREDILFELYPEKIVLPKQVYDELCHPSIPHFKWKMEDDHTPVAYGSGGFAQKLIFQKS